MGEIYATPQEWREWELQGEALERAAEFEEGLTARLKGNSVEGGLEKFHEIVVAFGAEDVPIEETQSALRRLLDLASDDALRSQVAGFLDAPLETEHDKKAASTFLCRFFGKTATRPRSPLSREWWSGKEAIMQAVGRRWGNMDEIGKFRDFMREFIMRPPDSEEHRRKLRAIVVGEEEIENLLCEHWKICDMRQGVSFGQGQPPTVGRCATPFKE
ncbi:hypothetical protein CPLU01_13392 [Colletotrichum plurivorum]|uniref:Uncharacterized protein n=1 Tax=Colletotrichum plurivorum TaxID=2175906 RepID=A0A8H6N2R9_9PEZI|nr:hypothetical protein CPLU01_13392 [Colletotrichum plurivorum]